MIIIHVKTIFEPVHRAIPKNIKCPNCGTENQVAITVYQKHIATGFSYKVTNKLTGSASCLNCNEDIANVQWTPEIESAFEYLKKEAPIEKPSVKWTILFKLLIGFLILFFSFLCFYFYSEYSKSQTKKELFENPSVNNKFLISHTVREDYTKTQDYGNSWAVIRKIDGDTLVIQFHENKVPLEELSESEAPINGYDGRLYKIKKDEFQKKQRATEFHETNGMGLNYAYIWASEEE